jgi:F-type H+-transporting ATPase subunit b
LNEAEAEARKIVGEAREAAEKVKAQIVEDARAEAQRTIDQGRDTLDSEKNAALAQLRAEVADLAVGAAGAILDAELDAERNRKIVDDFISRLPDSQGN